MSQPTIFFASFNARHLDPEQVAKNFVWSAHFTQLSGLQNALLIGPRGSGKTHLLKMLQPKALAAWSDASASQLRSEVQFIGVFVPADEAWSQQVQTIAATLSPDYVSLYKQAVFVSHVQQSLVGTIRQLVRDRPTHDSGFLRFEASVEAEADCCLSLARSWALELAVPSLNALQAALLDRLASLQEAAARGRVSPDGLLASLQTQLIPTVLQAINAFEAHIGRTDLRWALLFDELEIAPPEVQNVVFRCLRSTDQRLLFKIALSPSASAARAFREAVGPTSGNDFEEISLYADPRNSQIFCEALWKKVSESTSGVDVSPAALLGHSAHSISAAPRTRYSRTSAAQTAFSELATKDPSFAAFMRRKNVDPYRLDLTPRPSMDSVVRKTAPLVIYRNALIERGPSTRSPRAQLKRGKHSFARVYSGWEAICSISEANPRWFTGIARQLLIERSRGASGRDLSYERQYDVIEQVSRKFAAYIETIPVGMQANTGIKTPSLRELVGLLADRFRESALEGPFVSDPILGFQVDPNISQDLRATLLNGLYSGAFIPVGEFREQSVFSRLEDARLRVTFLLAPLERLPLRGGKDRKLSNLVESHAEASRDSSQMTLEDAIDDGVRE